MDLFSELYGEVAYAITETAASAIPDNRLGMSGDIENPGTPNFRSVWNFVENFRQAGGKISVAPDNNSVILLLLYRYPESTQLQRDKDGRIVIAVEKDAQNNFRRAEVEIMADEIVSEFTEKYYEFKDGTVVLKDKARKPPLSLRALGRFITQKLKESAIPSACRIPKDSSENTTDFSRVYGAEQAKAEIYNGYIYPMLYKGLFSYVKTRGMLLYGPPGTGKTEIVRALIGQLKGQRVALFSVTGGDLKGKLVGDTEKNIQALFQCAAAVLNDSSKYTFAVIFIDEFDSIGGRRGGEDVNMALSVNALLQAMDGIDTNPDVSVIAATNNPDKLDTAILSRLSTKVLLDLPNAEARKLIILRILGEAYGTKENFPVKTIPKLDLELNPQELAYIDAYGRHFLPKNDGTLSTTYGSLDLAAVKFLAKLMGPRPPNSGDDLNDQLIFHSKSKPRSEDQKHLPQPRYSMAGMGAEFSPEAKSTYGYSGRDIKKVMERAITIAALEAARKELSFYVGVPDVEKGPYWVYQRDFQGSRRPITYKTFGQLVDEMKIDTTFIITFTITKEHVIAALDLTPSTISGDEYIKLLRYNSADSIAKTKAEAESKQRDLAAKKKEGDEGEDEEAEEEEEDKASGSPAPA